MRCMCRLRAIYLIAKISRWHRVTKLWVVTNILTILVVIILACDLDLMTSSEQTGRPARKLTDWDSSVHWDGLQGNEPIRVNLFDSRNQRKFDQKRPQIDDQKISNSDIRSKGAELLAENSMPEKISVDSKSEGEFKVTDNERRSLIVNSNTSIHIANLKKDEKLLTERHEVRGRKNTERYCGMKKFLLFGIRPRWYQFCRSKSNPQYNYLVKFPRAISCKILKCTIILNYSEAPSDIADYDVVIFTNVYEWLTPEMWAWAHGNRTKGQRWVMITQESPIYVPGIRPPFIYGNLTYDWVDSYRRKSDFYHPYGWFKLFNVPRDWNVNVTNFMSRKTNLVAWMASHCETLQWDRHRFVDDLKTKVEVDTYGKCGDRELRWFKERLYTTVFTKYKFYLSLENSCCDEYITEKFWRALKLGILPIVVGAPFEHYLRVAPPNSFIHVDMFDSMDELVAYIIELDSNDAKYIDHFRWRGMGQLTSRPVVDHFLLPLESRTHCTILTKYVRSSPEEQQKLDYYSDEWHYTCSSCGRKGWMSKYMHGENYSRQNEDIWA